MISPMTAEAIVAVPSSRTVGQIRLAITSDTAAPRRKKDSPNSNVAVSVT